MTDTAVMEAEASAVYDILRDYCKAPESDRENFVYHQTHAFIREYRFVGSLGFGGKVWRTDARGRWRVSCYREDETPERLKAMALANEALLRMFVPKEEQLVTTVTLAVTVTFPMGKFDTRKTDSRYDVTNVIREALTEHATFDTAEVRYA